MSFKYKNKVKSWFTKDKVLLYLLSFVIAVVFWVAIIYYVNPDTTLVISDIPVKVNTSSQDAVSLSIVSGKVDTVDVEITAPRSQIPSLSKDSFSAEIDLTGEVKSGTYIKEIYVTCNSEFVKIISVTPSSTTIVLDATLSKTFQIDVDDGGFVAPDGYFIGSPTISSDTVTVVGPKSVVEAIAKASVSVDISEGSTGVFDFKDCSIVFLDIAGNSIESSTLESDVNSVTVSVPIVRKKTVPLKIDFANCSSFSNDFYSLSYSIGGETYDKLDDIEIAVVDDIYDSVTSISIGTLDFSKVHKRSYTEEFKLEMPAGVSNASGITSIGVTIALKSITTDSITISPEKITVNGIPEGKSATVTSKSIRVSVCGSPASITAAKNYGLSATVSLDNTATGGTREYPISVQFGNISDIWVYVEDGSAAPSVNIEIK